MKNSTCSAPECVRSAVSRGMCSRHYQRQRRGVSLEPSAGPSECRNCGERLAIPPYGQVPPVYCSKRCQSRWHYVNGGKARRDEARAANRKAIPRLACKRCSRVFDPETTRQIFCSKACSSRYRREHETGECSAVECDRPVRAKALCNKHYKAQLRLEGRLPTKTPWTDERRDAWHRRRALLLEASTGKPVILAEIADRDSWFCGLCKLPVDATLAYPDPMSKSLDHIVPLSKGGAHDPSNAQLAHLRCNVSKGNRAA